jgi:hypothetical protein
MLISVSKQARMSLWIIRSGPAGCFLMLDKAFVFAASSTVRTYIEKKEKAFRRNPREINTRNELD